MRILILTNLFPPHILGGYEILCGQVCAELTRRGHTMHVLTSDHGVPDAQAPGNAEPNIARDLRLYLPFDQPAQQARAARRRVGQHNYRITQEAIARFKPDIVFVWSLLRLSVGAARAAQDSCIPVAYTFNDTNISGYLPAAARGSARSRIAHLLDTVLLPATTLHGLSLHPATCISARLKNDLLALGVPVEKAQVIYQGIPIERFPCKADPGVLSHPCRVLYAGQLHPYKGVHTLLEAVGRVAGTGRELCVSIAGQGEEAYTRELQALGDRARSMGASIEFLGRRPHDELPTLYRSHDLFVFPSIWAEPFGLTHLEAMASGTPVISTADGGQGEFLRDGENALVFLKEDSAALAACLIRLMEDPALARRLAVAGRRTVEEGFTLAGYVAQLETWLEGSLQGSRQGT